MQVQKSRKQRIYVGCSLTHAPESFRRSVEQFKTKLAESYEVFNFLGLTEGSEYDVYNWDIQRCVKECDLFVAICDYASLGLGYELGVAVEAFKKPVLAVASERSHITRLVIGINAPNYTFKRYKKLDDVVELLARWRV